MRSASDVRRYAFFVAWVFSGILATQAVHVRIALGQDRAQLVALLSQPSDFRIRVQAALAIGNLKDPTFIQPLVGALSDGDPAVRAAAAVALEKIADPSATGALRRALRDPSTAVRRQAELALAALERAALPRSEERATSVEPGPELDASTRWIVHVGDVEDRSDTSADASARFREEVIRHLQTLPGIAVVPAAALDESHARIAARRRLPELRVDGTILRIRREQHGPTVAIRCEVSVMLLDAASRSIRAALSGSATGTQNATSLSPERERTLTRETLVAAVRSAMSRAGAALPQASAPVAARHP